MRWLETHALVDSVDDVYPSKTGSETQKQIGVINLNVGVTERLNFKERGGRNMYRLQFNFIYYVSVYADAVDGPTLRSLDIDIPSKPRDSPGPIAIRCTLQV